MTIILNIAVLLLMICVLVAAHEYGHYLFARLFKMDVEEFAIGFGRPQWVWRRSNGTDFSFRPIPLGGFVRIKGMVPEEDGSEIHVENGFYSKSPFARFLVLFAGPIFSIVFGVLVLVGLFLFAGIEKPTNRPILGAMNAKLPGAEAGLKAGDKVIRVAGQPVGRFYDMVAIVRERAGVPTEFEIEREGEKMTFQVTPIKSPEPLPVIGPELQDTGEKKVQGIIGSRIPTELGQASVSEAFQIALIQPIAMGVGLASLVVKPAKAKDSLGGPGTIAKATGDAMKKGFYKVFELASLLSISLGFMNLLPIPPLDGGQMVVAFVEMLRRGKRLSMRIQNAVTTVGTVLVLGLIVLAIALDVNRFAFNGKSNKPETKQESMK